MHDWKQERDWKQQQTARGRRDRLTAAATRCATEKGMGYGLALRESRLGPYIETPSLLFCWWSCCSKRENTYAQQTTCENNAPLHLKPKPNRPTSLQALCLIHLHMSVESQCMHKKEGRTSSLQEKGKIAARKFYVLSPPSRILEEREREEKQRTNHSNKISNGTIKINLKIKWNLEPYFYDKLLHHKAYDIL